MSWTATRTSSATSRPKGATDDEKPAMWSTMTEVWPDYDEHQKKTTRSIPVVVLERS
jgi:hypothetical protein